MGEEFFCLSQADEDPVGVGVSSSEYWLTLGANSYKLSSSSTSPQGGVLNGVPRPDALGMDGVVDGAWSGNGFSTEFEEGTADCEAQARPSAKAPSRRPFWKSFSSASMRFPFEET